MSKLLEVVVLHKLLPQLEPVLRSRQFAYRRISRTEFHAIELYDFAESALVRGKQVVIASLDGLGAVGDVAEARCDGASVLLCPHMADEATMQREIGITAGPAV